MEIDKDTKKIIEFLNKNDSGKPEQIKRGLGSIGRGLFFKKIKLLEKEKIIYRLPPNAYERAYILGSKKKDVISFLQCIVFEKVFRKGRRQWEKRKKEMIEKARKKGLY
jgi:hypothetical protein